MSSVVRSCAPARRQRSDDAGVSQESELLGGIYQKQPFYKPTNINIPPLKLGHKREDFTPNSVSLLSFRECTTPRVYVAPAPAIPPHPLHQWRCVSPTDRFQVESPHSILKRNFLRQYICETGDNSKEMIV
jgi:hypothetical protein